MFNTYPYTDFHELNADWILSKVKELDSKINDGIQQWVREQLNDLFVTAAYDAGTETLILTIDMEE